jgi:hypothetical protein
LDSTSSSDRPRNSAALVGLTATTTLRLVTGAAVPNGLTRVDKDCMVDTALQLSADVQQARDIQVASKAISGVSKQTLEHVSKLPA